MAFSYRDGLVKRDVLIKFLFVVITGQFLIISFLMSFSYELKKEQLIRIPADLRYTTRQKISETHESQIYSFAYYILQQVYTWRENGEEDFKSNIYFMQSYLTMRMRSQLTDELNIKIKNNELKNRVRYVVEIPGSGYKRESVQKIGDGRWLVHLKLTVKEYLQKKEIKSINIHYPVYVVHYDVDPELNDHALALDGYSHNGPKKIDENMKDLKNE